MEYKNGGFYNISFYGNKDLSIEDFMSNLQTLDNSELKEWLNLFKSRDPFLLLGKKYVYATNFKYNDSLGCSFFIKAIDSSDPCNCILGGCNPKIGLIVYNIYSRAISAIHTIDLIENNKEIESEFTEINGLVVRDLRPSLKNKEPRDQITELILLKQELEEQVSRILSLSVSPNQNKLLEFYDSLYPMIPQELVDRFETIQN